jgi:hypothetical protein
MYIPTDKNNIYSLTRWGWENPKPRFWHFEPWFSKDLEISENTILYITVGFFSKTADSMTFWEIAVEWWFFCSGFSNIRIRQSSLCDFFYIQEPTGIVFQCSYVNGARDLMMSSGGGGGEGFYICLWCSGRGMRFDCHSFPWDQVLVCTPD